VARASWLLCMENTPSSPNPLGVAGTNLITKTHAVAMLNATLQQIADHFDPCMGVRLVADATCG